MTVTKSQFLSQDLSGLSTLAEQFSSVCAEVQEQVTTQSGVLSGLPEDFEGIAADAATSALSKNISGLNNDVEALQALQRAVSEAHSDLSAKRDAVQSVLQSAQSQSFQVGDDWSVTDTSDTQGLSREAASQSVDEQLQSAVGEYHTADQTASNAIEQALDQFQEST